MVNHGLWLFDCGWGKILLYVRFALLLDFLLLAILAWGVVWFRGRK